MRVNTLLPVSFSVPDGMLMDRQQGGFQDSPSQTYQSLFPPPVQSSSLSPAVDAAGLYQPTKELNHRGASGFEHPGMKQGNSVHE